MSGEDNNHSTQDHAVETTKIKNALGDGPDATAVLNIGQLGQILNIKESTPTMSVRSTPRTVDPALPNSEPPCPPDPKALSDVQLPPAPPMHRNNHGHELPPAFESTATLSVRAGDPYMDPTSEAVLALKGYTAFRDLSEEGKQAVGQADGFLWVSEAKDSLTVGKITLDPETLSLLRCNSAADARYEIFARAMTGQTTTPEQMDEIIGAVNTTISVSRPVDVQLPPPNAGELLNSPATNRVVERPSEVGQGPH